MADRDTRVGVMILWCRGMTLDFAASEEAHWISFQISEDSAVADQRQVLPRGRVLRYCIMWSQDAYNEVTIVKLVIIMFLYF